MSKLLMNQLAATNMVYSRFSFGYFLDSMDRLGIHRLELYGCSTHFHFYDGDENPAPAMKKLLRQRGFQVVSLMPDISKLTRAAGFRQEVSFGDGIREMLKLRY